MSENVTNRGENRERRAAATKINSSTIMMIFHKFVYYIKVHFELCDLGSWSRVELFKEAADNKEECFRHFTECSTLALTNGKFSWWEDDRLRLPNILGGGEEGAVGPVGESVETKERTVSWTSWVLPAEGAWSAAAKWVVSCSRKEPGTDFRRN